MRGWMSITVLIMGEIWSIVWSWPVQEGFGSRWWKVVLPIVVVVVVVIVELVGMIVFRISV